MRLTVEGEINRTYCQNLCLIFFPGAKFPEKEPEGADVPEVLLRTRTEEGVSISEAVILCGGRRTTGVGRVALSSAESADRAVKRSVGEAMLRAGSELMGAPPPWGILTGVRPAKVAAAMLAGGLDADAVREALIKEYFVSEEKAALLCRICSVQEKAKALAEEGTCSLYISIPFCPTRCAYCSFVSYATPAYLATIPAYLDCLCLDIEATCRTIRERGEKLLTVYVGGGTPTILSAAQLDRLLSTVNRAIGGTRLLEFTVEAGRPDTVTAEKIEVMLAHGVDRTGINPQILDDDVLAGIGRRHTAADFYAAYELAARSGIPVINTDLIAGLPGSDFRRFAGTVDEIVRLQPRNVTVHTYCVKRAAEFTERAAAGSLDGIYSYSGDDTAACIEYSQRKLAEKGYLPYYLYRQKNSKGNLENVGYAAEGFEGLYNIFMMEELQHIYGVGAGAVTKRIGRNGGKITRIFEPKYTYEYLRQHAEDAPDGSGGGAAKP